MKFFATTIFIFCCLISTAFTQINDDLNRFQLAQRFKESGDYAKALPILQELYQKDQNNYQYFISLNETCIQLKNYFASIDLIDSRIKKFPQDINLYGMLGSSYYLSGNEQQAFKKWDEALQLFAQNLVNYRIIANFAIEHRAFDKAIEIFQKAKDMSEDKLSFSLELANLFSLTFRFEDAAKEFCEVLSINSAQQPLVESRISTVIDKPGAIDSFIKTFEEWDKNRSISFSIVLAHLYVTKKSYDQALDLYLDIDSELKKDGAELYNFALLLYNEKQFSEAQKVFNLVILNHSNSPVFASAKLGYAKSLEAELENEINNENYWKPLQPIIKLDPEKLETIISVYSEIASLFPDSDISDEALLQIGKIKFNWQNLIEEPKNIFYSIAQRSAFSKFGTEALLELGNILLFEGKIDSAEFYFLSVLKKQKLTDDIRSRANLKLAKLYFFKRDFTKVGDKLSDILSNLKDNSANDAIELSLLLNTSLNDSSKVIKFAEAEFFNAQKKYKKALEIYTLLSEDPQALFLSAISKERQAEILIALNDFDSAILILNRMSEEDASNIFSDKALYLKGNIYQFDKKDSARAIETYEKLLAQFPNSIYSENARILIKKLRSKLT